MIKLPKTKLKRTKLLGQVFDQFEVLSLSLFPCRGLAKTENDFHENAKCPTFISSLNH